MKKINLMFVIWAPAYGGAERYVLNIVRSLNKSKYNIVVFSDSKKAGPLQKEFESYGAEVVYAKYNKLFHPAKHIRQLKRLMAEKDIDIVHANDDQNMIFPLLAKPENTKFIAHAHNTKFQFTRSRIISKIATRILSGYISKHVDLRLSCGVDAGKATFCGKSFEVIPNGIELDKFKFSKTKRQAMRKKYNIDDDTIVLLNVGRIVEQKNHGFLLNVFQEYYKRNNNSKLFIIGDGKASLKNRIRKAEPKDSILLLPSQDNVADYYNMADVFIMTSLFEGLPIVSIEAQANGLKCIFADTITKEADCSGNVEFLSLSTSPEKWANVLEKNDFARKGKSADIDKYDIKNISKKMDEIYSNMVVGANK